ncbi:hypothetical protein ACJMK2_035384 [Sinanodonta woodiana]|uniref:Uncharacterized protein n=1 Tax=Sinanodonta woodiana TaxID=1069815 RepID=A0ABD3WUR8_SINWO
MQYIGISGESYHPSNILLTNEPWKGRVLYTGPCGVTDHRVRVEPENRYIGIGTMSREGSSEVSYLWRAAPNTPFPRPKTSRVGEIGWRVPAHADWSMPNSGRQIMLGHFRQECEDRHSHLYQNAWYPGPEDEFPPESDAARVMNVYRPASSGWPYRSTPLYRRASGETEGNQQQLQTIQGQ